MRKALGALVGLLAAVWAPAVLAADPAVEQPVIASPALDQAVFGFVGRYDQNTLGESFNPFDLDYDDLTAVGVGYQKFVAQLPLDVRFGYEVGVAGRFGSENDDQGIPGNTAEFWAGGLLRYDGFTLFDTLHVAASGTFGFSAVTDSSGYERRREVAKDGDARFLFMLAPQGQRFAGRPPQRRAFRAHPAPFRRRRDPRRHAGSRQRACRGPAHLPLTPRAAGPTRAGSFRLSDCSSAPGGIHGR